MKEGLQVSSQKKPRAPLGLFFDSLKVIFKFLLCGALAIVIIITIFAGLLVWLYLTPYSGSSFDQEKWMERAEMSRHGECARGAMGDDIVDNILKIGMTRKEVEGLLGESDSDYYSEMYPNEFIYNLGMCSGLRWDFDFLHVTYDKENKLIRAFNAQH